MYHRHGTGGRAMLFVAMLLAMPHASADEPQQVAFNEHIRPILVAKCVACHGGPKQAGGISFLYRTSALSEGDSGEPAIVPGSAEQSYLIERVSDPDEDYRMPPAEHGPALTEHEISLLRQWVDAGAVWQEHWSLVPPELSTQPAVKDTHWPNRPLDFHVLARLESQGLAPSPAAPKAQWLRRVTFDLTGLPPTESELKAFLSDSSDDAYEKVVDRLLASPAYGERWASMWLDLARYADTQGYEKDPHREIWPYRDWLIRALNADMPYDEFVVKQLAGDLLPNASLDDRLATAFHRNTQTNTEGGTDDEEFRLNAVVDRVNTTWQVFQGMTFGCTQCHSHPYDAFEQEEYYKFLAVLNNTRDCDLPEDYPVLRVPKSQDQVAECEQLEQRQVELGTELFRLYSEGMSDDRQWNSLTLTAAKSTGAAQLSIREMDGNNELVAGGTISQGSRYTIDCAASREEPITALRIDALPMDPENSLRIPEEGFALSRLQCFVASSDGTETREVALQAAFCDELDPVFDPEDSLYDNHSGWSVFTKIYHPRYAVFLPAEPLRLADGETLRLVLHQNRNTSGLASQVIRRGRFSVSTNPQWSTLLTGQEYKTLRDELGSVREQLRAIPSTLVPVLEERDPVAPRPTQVFVGGSWLERGDTVQPGVPASMPPLVSDGPADRLDVARWIASDSNPLTSRTMVNRLWEQLFGLGIVETVEDLGASGQEPSNQALLDSLAMQFQGELGWSVKRLLKEIVLSSTYRQDARVPRDLQERDPRNQLLARGPRGRLQAEMLRDQALVLSGRYSQHLYGPAVMPYQPDGVWQSVYNGSNWQTSQGEDRFRRALYTYWKRTSAYPSMLAFDMNSREVCVARRIATNTPLQALVTLNDPAFMELANSFAKRARNEGGANARDQIAWAYRQATGQQAADAVIDELCLLHEQALQKSPAKSSDTPDDSADQFAMTVVASTILNLDGSLTK